MKKSTLPASDMLFSCDAEQAVLGGLMLDNDRWDDMVLALSPEDFYLASHRAIYRAMSSLAAEGQPLDLITLSARMEQQQAPNTPQNHLEQVGGFAYLAELSKNTPSAANINAYARIVASKSRLRQLLSLGRTLCADAADPRADVESVLERAEKALFSLGDMGQTQPKHAESIFDCQDRLLLKLQQNADRDSNGITGIPTGFNELDTMTCGLQRADLVLLAARPSMGKTSLALSFCCGAVESSPANIVQYYSLEMSAEQLIMRLMSMVSGVELTRLRNGELYDRDWDCIGEAAGRIASWKDQLFVDDSSGLTPTQLRSKARRNARLHGHPCLIAVDYLQLMRESDQENRTQEIAEISRSLKALAKEMSCPVLALSQLNRQLENRIDKRPVNADLRDSGALEQDADLIMFIYRDEVYHPDSLDAGMAEIILGKQRQGPTGTVRVRFEGAFTRFSDLTKRHHLLSRGGLRA